MKKKQLHKSNWLVTMLLLVMAILMPYGGAWAQAKPSSGDGSVGNPYKISSAAELAWFRNQVNSGNNSISAELTENIDLAEFCHAKDGTKYTEELSWTPIGNSNYQYLGTFDGKGKTISNLYINATSDNTGFFYYANYGSIKNIIFDNAKVKNTALRSGILVGDAGSCAIENIKTLANCSVDGNMSTGGIAGYASGDISNCENRAAVKGTRSLGGVVGSYVGAGSITSCANYGTVTGSESIVGGMVGSFDFGTIQNSANYGDITGADMVGNLIGTARKCNLNNVLGTGYVTATSDTDCAGLLVGEISKGYSITASGILAYNSSAKLTINGTEQTDDAVKAIGYGSMTSVEKIMAFSAEQLKSGLVAFLLHENASESAKWGQKLNTDNYPLLGSTNKVYSDSPVKMKCSGELEDTGTFTNTKPAQEGTFSINHGDSPIHHKSEAATCTVDGKMEYWECNLCHKPFSDELMTQEVSNLVVSATGHEYDENDKCTKCQQEIPFLTNGDNNITIGKVFGEKKEISGYNLYKYTAPEDGTLAVTANSNGKDTYGTLWESRTAASYLTCSDGGNGSDFKITNDVTKGSTYYIGARQYYGDAIEGEVKLNVKLTVWKLPAGMTGKGTDAEPFVLKTAEHLAWFRDYVNDDHLSACAKIADNVEVIDLKDFCHAADASQNLNKLSWEPIGNSNKQYRGTFDGNNKTITNLYINESQDNMGFFGSTDQSTIKNLTFVNANVVNTSFSTGILVGNAGYGSTLQNIKISNTCQIKGGNCTGGIAGNLDGNAYNCVNCATVQGIGIVGGLFGNYVRTDNSITACANYGNVTASDGTAGGLVGSFQSGTIQDCANYGDVKGAIQVAGMAGDVEEGKIQNVFNYGNVSATMSTQDIGMAFGNSYKGATTEGMVAYYSGAKLIANGQEQTAKAFGTGDLSEDNATGFTEAQLKSGVVAYLLQQNASSKAKWGQNLANDGDIYPVIGSEHQVYATEDLLVNCKTYEVVRGSFTNNPTSSAIKYQHGTTNHHVATDATCTEAATKEYWQCQDCQRTYSDSQLTVELTDVTNADQPAIGHHSNEDGYCDRCQHYVAVKPSKENGVYLIAKPCHLAWFRDYVNGTIVDEGEATGTTHSSASAMLTADIDLKNYCHAAEDGKELLSWIPIGNNDNRWKGNMDGQGHTISHLYIKTAQDLVGLFGYTDGATIQDLIFDNAKVENVSTTGMNTLYTGILAGRAYGDSPLHIKGIKTTNNCTVIGQEGTGGIVGGVKINLENCENRSSVKGTRFVGGIAGSSTERNIRRSTNYGTVENDDAEIGGIIGYADDTSIEDCANYGKITSTGWYAGGIAGHTLFNGSIQNVFSYGDVTNTNTNTNDNPGIIIGYVDGTLTAKGIVAYNKEALLNNSSENIKIVGEGSLTFEDGKVEADVVKAFTKQQIKSGEVAWLLNGSTSVPTEGSTLAWYQKLGENAYPVLTAAEGNTVYNGSFRYCDGTASSYSNSSSENELVHVASATLTSPKFDADKHIYHMGCSNENCPEHKYAADADGTLKATQADGKFYVEKLALTDASTAINTQAQFTIKDLQYSRQLNEGQKGYVTLCLPFDINVADVTGVEKCYPVGDMMIHMPTNDASVLKFVLMLDEQSVIKAGTPMIVKLAAENAAQKLVATAQNVEYNASFFAAPTAKTLTLRDWDGKSGMMPICHDLASATIGGVYTATTLEPGSYSLREDGTFGIYENVLSPYRVYLNIQTSQSAPSRAMMFSIGMPDDSSTTGIRIINMADGMQTGSSVKSSAIYTLEGQRVKGTPRKGIYIKNGKKFIVK